MLFEKKKTFFNTKYALPVVMLPAEIAPTFGMVWGILFIWAIKFATLWQYEEDPEATVTRKFAMTEPSLKPVIEKEHSVFPLQNALVRPLSRLAFKSLYLSLLGSLQQSLNVWSANITFPCTAVSRTEKWNCWKFYAIIIPFCHLTELELVST